METDYSKRELDAHFMEVKTSLKEIKEQTTKTNGRVNKLESVTDKIIGGLIVLNLMVVPAVVAIVVKWLSQLL